MNQRNNQPNRPQKRVNPTAKTTQKKTQKKTNVLSLLAVRLSKRSAKPKKDKKREKNGEVSTAKKVFSTVAIVFLTILLIGCITGTIVVGAFAIYIKKYIDPVIEDFDLISTEQKLSSKIYYMDYTDRENRVGTPVELDTERLYGSENRVWVTFDEMPTYLYEAFISIEDERFWVHDGVDWKRTLGATFYFFTGADNYGGSTITQQLIKNLTGEKDVRIQRKLQEIMRALYLDKTKDKTEILELYLNTIYLSQGCYGVQAAANVYFGKSVSELTLVECAALASITQAPTKWDPIQNPDNNEFRRKTVLDKMYELGKITYSEYQEARNQELELVDYKGDIDGDVVVDENEDYNSWYTDAVIKSVVERLMEEKGYPENLAYNMLYSGGLKIYTVMDPEIQAAIDKVYVENSAAFQDDRFPGILKPESSMVIIHPTTGDVLGLAGGRGEKKGNLLLNYATQTTRSPGSTIKPLTVYAPALEAGIITYGSVYDDVPVNYDTGKYTVDEDGNVIYVCPETGIKVIKDRGWPANLPDTYDGLIDINYALQVSKNTVSVKVLQDLTCEASFDFAKNKLHMNNLIEKLQLSNGQWITDKGLSALALGEMNYGLTNLEVTAAYSIFTNSGVYNEPRLYTQVLDSEDNVVLDDDKESSIVLSEQNSYIMTLMLKNVINNGTGSGATLRKKVDVAGKTGTTNSDHDRWFVAYTPYLLGGVWFGYSDPDSLSRASGNPAVGIWNEVMTLAHQKYFDEAAANGTELKKFEEPGGIVSYKVCADSGMLMTEACRSDPRGSRETVAYYASTNVPTKFCDCHVLVEYDKVTSAIACDGCPDENIVKIGLLKITDRNFPEQVKVRDAQYTYRYISSSARLPNNNNVPFYAYVLGDKYSGITGNGEQFNRACYKHYKEPPVSEEQVNPAVVQDLPPSKKSDKKD
ncbi:MAG: transglycosylase [Ruminococcaceae bacterium]|nr:transglycosylase [Oscillospiraceae bacterium]